jgi:cellulose synthase/poly-beta-1,6-N-acetylglucosamine synthase-like glycosyltransferase
MEKIIQNRLFWLIFRAIFMDINYRWTALPHLKIFAIFLNHFKFQTNFQTL